MIKYISFISDIHLSPQTPERFQQFKHYLNVMAPQCEAIYILVDLFNCYAGKDQYPSFYQDALKSMTHAADHCAIYFLPGNRDFLAVHDLFHQTPVVILSDYKVINVFGQKTLLSHGDRFDRHYTPYQCYRTLSSKRWFCKTILSLPSSFRWKKSQALRQYSQKVNHDNPNPKPPANIDYMDILAEKFRVKNIIHGHLHTPRIQTTEKYRRIILGEWVDHGHHLLMGDDESLILDSV